MKKILATLLSLTLVLSLTACGESGNTSESKETLSSSESEEPANESSDDLTADSGSEEPSAKEDSTASEPEPVAFEEISVVDNDECTITITGIDEDNLWGYTLKAFLENKSSDKNYMFSVSTASINGVKNDPLFATEVAAGKKSNEEISFNTDNLEKNGITQYTDIALSFRVHDNDDWMADPVYQDTIHVYPYGEDKAETFVRGSQSSDTILADNDYATVIVTGYETDSIWGYTVNLYILNKTSDHTIMFSVDDAAVNGYMIDPFFATEIEAGICSFTSMSFSDTELEDNGITAIDDITFTLRAHDSEDFGADDFINESITLNP